MKAPQLRKTAKRIKRDGWPTVTLSGDDESVTVAEILEGRPDTVTFTGREQVEVLRDFAQAWLDHDDESQ